MTNLKKPEKPFLPSPPTEPTKPEKFCWESRAYYFKEIITFDYELGHSHYGDSGSLDLATINEEDLPKLVKEVNDFKAGFADLSQIKDIKIDLKNDKIIYTEKVPNPSYERLLKEYEKKLAEYKVKKEAHKLKHIEYNRLLEIYKNDSILYDRQETEKRLEFLNREAAALKAKLGVK